MRLAFVTFRALPQLADDDRLAVTELRQHGVAVESAVWDSPLVDWGRYDALVIRSTWDYHERADAFEGWLAHIEHLGVPLWNPAPLMRWNMDKRYLLDLATRGVPTVPTICVDRGTAVTLSELLLETGWGGLVYKPVVSASAVRAEHVKPGAVKAHEASFAALVAQRDMLVQPLLSSSVEDGEWSLVFFNGQYSHAVRKRPQAGHFLVADDFGGNVAGDSPRGAAIAHCEAIVAQLPGPWLYARVDACEVDGALLLLELELIEPELFLRHHPSAPRRFATAIRQLVAGRRTPVAFTPRSVTPPDGTRS